MKRISILLSLLFIAVLGFSQNFNLSYSEMIPNNYYTSIQTAGKIGNTIYQVKTDKKGMYLDIYDASKMNLIRSTQFKSKQCDGGDCIDKHFDYVKTTFLKNGIIMFFETFDKKNDVRLLYAQKINLKGNFDGKLVEIDRIETKKRREGSFDVWQNDDSTKIMIIDNPPFEKYNNEKFGFKIYNWNLTNEATLSITLPYKDKNVSVVDYYLGNNNKIYMLTRVDLEKENRVKGQAPYFFSILTIEPKNSSVNEFKVSLPNKNIEDIVLRLDKENKLITCAGFYSDLKPKEYVGKDIDGFFNLTIDATTQQVVSKGFKNIDKAMIAELTGKKSADKVKEGKGISNNFEIRYMKKRQDGTTTMISEYRTVVIWTTTTCSQNGGCITHTNYTYYRNNIFVVNIAADGSVTSFIDIPKCQVSTNDGGMYSSFLTCEKNDNIYLIYNDHPDNLNPNVKTFKDVKAMPRLNKACLVAVGINKDGSYTKTKIQDNATKKLIAMPESGMQVGKGEYIIPVREPIANCACMCTILFKKLLKGFVKISL
jgi:hypothetical protein